MSIVRDNLMGEKDYTPYCGDTKCKHGMSRTTFNGSQFKCLCGWVSEFPAEFIESYKKKWDPERKEP